ncbi:MAG: CoA transferase, partial [Actinobacteria bacterium]|nr:CoA transferase [Actinomycetota bacterium]
MACCGTTFTAGTYPRSRPRATGPFSRWPAASRRQPGGVRLQYPRWPGHERRIAVGPLQGVKIVEIAGIGPGPFAAMLLSDLGADVIRVDRTQAVTGDFSRENKEVLNRGRRSVGVDLKNPDGVETVMRLVEQADALIEGFRPGVAERLGIGPDACLARNPKLVFGRMTGWGQEGPYAMAAGHDINYIAVAGA